MIGTIIYNLFITPLEYIFEVVFCVINRVTGIPAIAIIGLSLVMNFLVLPLYKRADAIQEEERDKVASMSEWVNHIKKTFKGDERYMMLNTYYRQQNYKPIYALRSSFSLILQIPFFIAAYHFLSNLPLLEGESFLFLSNLGAPDQLLHMGSITINVMPIIMTLINFISGFIYLRGFPIKDKIQTYGIGIIFLILLYNSPSGLVFYWTLNQIFSMLKNVFMKLVKSRKVLNAVFSSAGIILVVLAVIFIEAWSTKRVCAIILLFLICQIPLILSFIRKQFPAKKGMLLKETKYRIFLAGGVFMSLLSGVIIPLSVISASPTEFVTQTTTPTALILSTLATSIGYFIIWFGIFYYLANQKGKLVFSYLIWAISGIAVVDFMFFSKSLGTMSIYLIFDNDPQFSTKAKLLNLIIIIALIVLLSVFMYFFDRFIPYVYLALIIGAIALSTINGIKVQQEIKSADVTTTSISHEKEKIIPLSKKGNNVIVFMLDRAVSVYLPYIFQEKPELRDAFSGFTFYPNTISFGGHTNLASPQLFGGYEYRPLQMNERDKELLVDKQNESLKVMPKLFLENGYKVTVCDPPYAGYDMIGDLSIYDDLEGVNTYHTMGRYQWMDDISVYNADDKIVTRNFFFYSIFKTVPVIMQNTVYDKGNYYSSKSRFQGLGMFMNSYSVLEALPEISEVSDTDTNTFLMISNDTTHEPVYLEWPDYTLTQDTDVPHLADISTYVIDGEPLQLETKAQIQHYDINMAAYLSLSKWMQFLKSSGVYDNTRIIFVADHGANLRQSSKLYLGDIELGKYNPLLLVKDFNSTGFSVSNEFMTNADVPTLATKDLFLNPINPYTGKALNNDAKYNEKMILTTSTNWDTDENNGTTFDTSDGLWLEVHDNIFDSSNWSIVTP